ncbi:hypothetical protein [Comamonas sp. 26]|uniref:hypothetical protein n=1 Tax=Comamonas sp. 26 TaxID=2035201 RepID=UPI000C39F75E|nr:hypothetical protein [Comamonas sp. 26]PIG08679.1 hypothetical protein CLU84_1547 [Comamonas sp. 26]
MIDVNLIHRRKLLNLLINHFSSNEKEYVESFSEWGGLYDYILQNVRRRDELILENEIDFDVSKWSSLCHDLAKKIRFDLYENPNFDTQTIVDALAFFCRKTPQLNYFLEFKEWSKLFLEVWPQFIDNIPRAVVDRMPYGTDVHARIYYEIFGIMPFSKDFIYKNYESLYSGKNFLLFPSFKKCAKKLVVLFSGNVGRKTYNRYSWYWDERENWQEDCVYLFLNDIESHWYVGAAGQNEIKLYAEIILQVMKNYDIAADSVYTVGGSMGGYAAILFAINLRLRAAIAVNPQLCFRSALRYKEPSWENKLRECGENFRDLSDEVFRHDSRPVIYLEQSQCEADQVGFDDFFHSLRRSKSFLILRQTENNDHFTENPTKESIYFIMKFIEEMKSQGV